MISQAKHFKKVRRPNVFLIGCKKHHSPGLALLVDFSKKAHIQPSIVRKPLGDKLITGEMRRYLCQGGLLDVSFRQVVHSGLCEDSAPCHRITPDKSG